MSIPVIIDCDPGHDDVFAIWLAAGNPNIDLKGVTTVGGNGQLHHTTLNARIACTVAGISDVPIAMGADKPLARDLVPASSIHGENALGGPDLPEPTIPLDARSAIDLMVDIFEASDEPITLVPTGPLTNIAHLIQQRPEVLSKVREIVWMGGSTTRGNATPYAEFNAWADPEAVDVVLKAGVQLTMVGLNITHQALITEAVRHRIQAIGNESSAFGAELLNFFCSTYAVSENMPDAPLHDPITIASIADPGVAESIRTRVDVELQGTETAGATSVDLHNRLGREENVTVLTQLDADKFWDLVESAVRNLK